MRSQERAARAAHARLATEDPTTDDPRSRSPSVVTLRPSDAELGLDTWKREQGLDAVDDDVEVQTPSTSARGLMRVGGDARGRGEVFEAARRELEDQHQRELDITAARNYIRGKGKGHAAAARAALEAVDAARAAQRSDQPPLIRWCDDTADEPWIGTRSPAALWAAQRQRDEHPFQLVARAAGPI